MISSNTYLIFNGNCREAMNFYKQAIGGDLQLMTFGEAPGADKLPKGTEDRIVHAYLSKGPMVIMASDNMPGMPHSQGNNFSISLNCETIPESEKLFAALGAQAQKITMPLGETFWAIRFAMLTDKFGVNWMINLGKPAHQTAGK